MKAKQSFLELLQTLATYAAIVTPILAPVLAFSGFNLDDRLLTAFVVVFLLALVYLASQYRKAKQSIEAEGIVQRPQWLWRLLTNRITHIPKQLNTGTIMVIVPPSMREQYTALKDIHNQNNQINLLSHYLPAPSSGSEIDEDCAESKLNERRRPVSDLELMLEDCEGITLLDDGSWQRYKLMYPRTWKVINDWSNKHTVRPVMAIRVEGEGTLKYSWCNLDETIVNNQALLSKMLSLTTDRGSSWFNQATSQRRLVLILSGTLVAIGVHPFCETKS